MHSDPFVEMAKNNKKYGYVTALWEIPETVPSLFNKISDYKRTYKIGSRPVWNAMIEPSYLPWPIRPLLRMLPNRNVDGNRWNLCHFWNNFEIADMNFFRSPGYRRLFEYLDAEGGFYYERVRYSHPVNFSLKRSPTDRTRHVVGRRSRPLSCGSPPTESFRATSLCRLWLRACTLSVLPLHTTEWTSTGCYEDRSGRPPHDWL